MARRRSLFVALVLIAALTAAQETPRTPTFSSQVELVTVDAVVLDRKGQLVRGLTREDFTIVEDGKPQEIASFEAFDQGADAEEAPLPREPGPVVTNAALSRTTARIFVILVDDLSLAPPRATEVRAALTRFLTTGLRDGDELIFTTSSGEVWWSTRMPEGREDILALVERLRGRRLFEQGNDYVSEWEAYQINNFEGVALDIDRPGLPSGTPADQIPRTVTAPGSNITERVFRRFVNRHVCDERAPAACYILIRGRAAEIDQRRRNRTGDVLAAVDRATEALIGLKGRKSLLLWTEGFLSDPNVSAVQEVAGRCREANLAVYSLDVRGLFTGIDQMDASSNGVPNSAELALIQMEQTVFVSEGSAGLAEDTGGFALRNTNDLVSGATRVTEESRVYYLLGFVPPAGKRPRDWRKLKVEVKRPGLEVRARRGYSLGTAEEMAAAAPAKKRASGKAKKEGAEPPAAETAPPLPLDMARALFTAHDATDIPLRAMAYVFGARPEGTARVIVALEARVESLANPGAAAPPAGSLSLSIAVTHRDTGKTQRFVQRRSVDAGSGGGSGEWVFSSRELDLPSGVSQARVVVRDERRGSLGAVTLRFVVPKLEGLRLSTPILTDRVTKGKAGAPQPVLLVRREFPPTKVLYCQFQVFGAQPSDGGAPRVEASYELRRKDGATLRKGTPSLIAPAEGALVRMVGISLEGMDEGDYELVLRIEDKVSGETQDRVEALRLTSRAG